MNNRSASRESRSSARGGSTVRGHSHQRENRGSGSKNGQNRQSRSGSRNKENASSVSFSHKAGKQKGKGKFNSMHGEQGEETEYESGNE